MPAPSPVPGLAGGLAPRMPPAPFIPSFRLLKPARVRSATDLAPRHGRRTTFAESRRHIIHTNCVWRAHTPQYSPHRAQTFCERKTESATNAFPGSPARTRAVDVRRGHTIEIGTGVLGRAQFQRPLPGKHHHDGPCTRGTVPWKIFAWVRQNAAFCCFANVSLRLDLSAADL